ncbi:hypothetical protein ACRRRU_16840, partial [Dickeya fangzhongdai]|uniref:hypothetical protein n=1 Tax=Dickeya fangzhongdai TaxID=1778540 RepID=UPI003D7D7794
GLKLNHKVYSPGSPSKLTLFHVVIANHDMSKIQASPCRACDEMAKKRLCSFRTKPFTAQTDFTIPNNMTSWVGNPVLSAR